ncbi:MAG: hypothetical protein ACI82H_001963, partial [Alphaproteobacteria bacterium]
DRNTLRKTQSELPRHDPHIRHKIMDQLSPHPNQKLCLTAIAGTPRYC